MKINFSASMDIDKEELQEIVKLDSTSSHHDHNYHNRNISFLRCESVANPKHNSDNKKYNNDDKFNRFASFKNSWPICKSIMDQAIIIDDSLNNEQGKEAIKRAASKLIEELQLII